jgi:hypothetical protein
MSKKSAKKRRRQERRAAFRRKQGEAQQPVQTTHQAAVDPQSAPDSAGGLGVPSGPEPSPYQGDLKGNRLEQKAITQRWPVKEQFRAALINRQITIGIDPNSSPKEATAAFRAVLAADLANMEQEKRDLQIPERHEHHHTGTVTVEERREFWVHLGQILRNVPEQRDRVAALLRQHIESEGDVGKKEAHEQRP